MDNEIEQSGPVEVMRPFVLYDPETGIIEKSGLCGPLDWEAQEVSGLEIVATDGFVRYPAFVKDGLIYALPPSPGDWAVFDFENEVWIDQRDDEQRHEDIKVLRASAIQDINEAAGVARRSLMTNISGQSEVYLEKKDEATAYLSDPDPVMDEYPLIASALDHTAPDPYSVAQVFLNLSFIRRHETSKIENVRLGFISQIEQADDEDAIKSILTQAQEEMSHA